MASITSNFDGGNIEVISTANTGNIRLNIRKDTLTDHFQWFFYRVSGVVGERLTMKILNAGNASYPEAWEGYQARATYDLENWFLVPTTYDGKTLTIRHKPAYNSVFYAFYPSYSYDQYLRFLHSLHYFENCSLESLGKTIRGREIDLVTIGTDAEDKKKIWILSRQHPGESMASYFSEGIISRLLDTDDPVSRVLLEKAVFYVVPFVNPDGAIEGNLRCNVAGKDLNRAWGYPDPETTPEVFHILEKMKQTGVDLNFDIHGDETLPYVFISSIEGIPSFDDRLRYLLESFRKHWLAVSPDFQVEQGYPVNEPGKANLNICSKAIGERFGCLSMTIEMPFKDNQNLPDRHFGWSPSRCARLGQSIADVILRIVDELR